MYKPWAFPGWSLPHLMGRFKQGLKARSKMASQVACEMLWLCHQLHNRIVSCKYMIGNCLRHGFLFRFLNFIKRALFAWDWVCHSILPRVSTEKHTYSGPQLRLQLKCLGRSDRSGFLIIPITVNLFWGFLAQQTMFWPKASGSIFVSPLDTLGILPKKCCPSCQCDGKRFPGTKPLLLHIWYSGWFAV